MLYALLFSIRALKSRLSVCALILLKSAGVSGFRSAGSTRGLPEADTFGLVVRGLCSSRGSLRTVVYSCSLAGFVYVFTYLLNWAALIDQLESSVSDCRMAFCVSPAASLAWMIARCLRNSAFPVRGLARQSLIPAFLMVWAWKPTISAYLVQRSAILCKAVHANANL